MSKQKKGTGASSAHKGNGLNEPLINKDLFQESERSSNWGGMDSDVSAIVYKGEVPDFEVTKILGHGLGDSTLMD